MERIPCGGIAFIRRDEKAAGRNNHRERHGDLLAFGVSAHNVIRAYDIGDISHRLTVCGFTDFQLYH
jgi:hypothetical protein